MAPPKLPPNFWEKVKKFFGFSSAADDAAKAAVAAERAAVLHNAQASAFNVITHTNAGYSHTLRMSTLVDRLRALLPRTVPQGNTIPFRARLNFGETVEIADELLNVSQQALSTAQSAIGIAKESIGKSRVITNLLNNAANAKALNASERAAQMADDYLVALEQANDRLTNLVNELRGIRDPNGADLDRVRSLIEQIGAEVLNLRTKSAAVVGAAKEAESLSRSTFLSGGLDQDFYNNNPANMMVPLHPQDVHDAAAWVGDKIKEGDQAIKSGVRGFGDAIRGDDGQGDYRLKESSVPAGPMCFPKQPEVCEDSNEVWNKVGDPSQPVTVTPTGPTLKP